MVINGPQLLIAAPIKDMLIHKVQHQGVSHGLAEVGYDIRLKQDIWFYPSMGANNGPQIEMREAGVPRARYTNGRFTIASAIEEFHMPNDLMGIVHDKSTWARKGVSVFNTVIEPGWRGFLTLELVFHSHDDVYIPAGSGIAQVIFHQTSYASQYQGKYQDQADKPVEAILA